MGLLGSVGEDKFIPEVRGEEMFGPKKTKMISGNVLGAFYWQLHMLIKDIKLW